MPYAVVTDINGISNVMPMPYVLPYDVVANVTDVHYVVPMPYAVVANMAIAVGKAGSFW